MPVYYRGPCARITHEVVEVWCPTYQLYAIRDLSHAWIEEAKGPANPTVVGSAGMAGALALILTLGWSAGWDAVRPPLVRLLIVVLFLASAVLTGACWRARPVECDLVALHLGEEVILYRDRDPQRFDQLARALVRALEHAEDTRPDGIDSARPTV